MKHIITFALALFCGLAFADPSNNLNDLKINQGPSNGLQLNGVSDSQADANAFKNCTFGGIVTYNGGGIGFGSSGHPAKVAGSVSLPYNQTYIDGDITVTAYLKGAASSLLVESYCNGDNTGDGGGFSSFVTTHLDGSTPTLQITTENDPNGHIGTPTNTFTSNQSSPISVYTSCQTNDTNEAHVDIELPNCLSVTFTTCALYGMNAFQECSFTVNAPAATSFNLSPYGGSDAFGTITVNTNCAAPVINSGMPEVSNFVTWSGPFSSAFLDALIIAWDGGSANSTLTVSGTTNSRTSASDAAYADLVSNGCTVTLP